MSVIHNICIYIPIRNLSSWQRWEWLEIVDYGGSCLEMPMQQENLELVIVDYPRNFLYWKLNYKQRWSSSVFPSVPNMFVKVVGISAIFDDSQLLAGYHWHFHAYPMILSVYVTDYIIKFWKQTHTHTRTHTHAHACALETIYSIIFQLNEICKMCTWFSKMYVVPCISNHYIRIKIQEIF